MKHTGRSDLDSERRPEEAAGHQETAGSKDAARTRSRAVRYRIVVRGHLDGHWSDWFDGLAVRRLPDGETALEGGVRDQAELYGHLMRLRDLGLTLVSVSRMEAWKPVGTRAI